MLNQKSNKHLSISELIPELSKYIDKEVVDIIIFGSAVKGKTQPKDIDIAIVLKDENYNLFDSIAQEIRQISPMHIDVLFASKIFEEPLYLTLLHEGFSVKHNKFVHDLIKSKSYALCIYDISTLEQSKKTLFGYALMGRSNQKGILQELKGEKAGKSAVLIPTNEVESIKEFFRTWNIKFTVRRFLELKTIV